MKYSPVALFVFNRIDNTRQTIENLLANTLAPQTDLYVFSDGGRDEASWAQVNALRNMLHTIQEDVMTSGQLHSMSIIERSTNIYLERNITEGVAEILEKHETIIVLEDDICTSPYFLLFMNEALATYAKVSKVFHISGFTHLDILNDHPEWLEPNNETYFTHHMSGWGWATWRDRWQGHFRHYVNREEALRGLTEDDINQLQYNGAFPCLHHLDQSPIPWDICWEIAIHRAGGLCLSPAHTLVRNIGLHTGTHFQAWRIFQSYPYDREPLYRPCLISRIDTPNPDARIEAAFAEAIRDWGIKYTPLGKVVRWIYRKVKRAD